MDRFKIKKNAWKFTGKNFLAIYKGLIFAIIISLVYAAIYTFIVKDNIGDMHKELMRISSNLTLKQAYVSIISSLAIYNISFIPLSLGGIRSFLGIYNLFVSNHSLLWIKSILLIINIMIIPLSYGVSRYMLLLVRNKKPKLLENIFYYYKHNILSTFVISSIIAVAMFIGLQLIAFPCVYIYLITSMSKDLLADGITNPLQVIKENYCLLKGYKWDYFNFLVSFVGWFILCFFTMGIALIWVVPYMVIAQKMYYEQLRKLKK